jgi:HlyD family secretion protein
MTPSSAERSAKVPDRGPSGATAQPAFTKSTPSSPPPSTSGDEGSFWSRNRNRILIGAVAALVVGVAAWVIFGGSSLPQGFAGGNGRLEANQIYVATKYAGRIKQVLFNEGDTVNAGQVVAVMDTSPLEAQLREAEAQISAAQDQRNVALAQVDVKQANYNYAAKQYQRSRGLVGRGAVSAQEAEVDLASMLSGRAELVGAKAQVVQASATIDAAKATADRLRAEIHDATLVAPVRARIESRLAEPGEVLDQGGRVFSLVDLSDVYMYVFLPEKITGKVPLGSEARIVLDAAPQYPIRAFVSYVSPVAQFTPKSVETAEERHNLTFRVKLQIPRERLVQFEALVKSGLPGMGYVRFDQSAEWPDKLKVKPTVPTNLWQPTGAKGST